MKVKELTLDQTQVYNVAIYCRLSRDDGMEAVSQSIVSQKESLSKYVLSQGWNIADVYIDDGFSGTTFERPAFKRLLTDIENNKVNCVITKDLSRLGRNYLQTGYYTEEYFPLHNIRYIAVNDGYDSLEEDNDFTPFKNIINEWYAKDISKKVKSSFRHRQQEGTLIINSPYGYVNDKEKGRSIDKITAPIVEYIFLEFTNGKSVLNICKELTQKQILTPKAYKSYYENKDSALPKNYTIQDSYTWTKSIVYSILNEYQYTGALICNKYHNLSFKMKKVIRQKAEEWIIHENRFEPIISKEIFNKAKTLLKNAGKAQLPLTINKYNGILYCKDCGRKATFLRTEKNPKGLYLCRVKGCPSKRITIEELNQVIQKEILSFKEIVLKNEKSILNFLKKAPLNQPQYETTDVLEQLEQQKKEILESLAYAFEEKCNGEMLPSVYNKVVSDFNTKLNDINSKIDMLTNNTLEASYDVSGAMTFLYNIKGFNEYSKITRNILTTLIRKITYTYTSDNIFRFEIEYIGIDWLVKDFGKIITK